MHANKCSTSVCEGAMWQMEAVQVHSAGIAPLSCGIMVPSTGTNNEIEKKGIPCAGCQCVIEV